MGALTDAWDESTPPGSEAKSNGDNRIRQLKQQLREWFQDEHNFPSSGSAGDTNTGTHKKVTLTALASTPTVVADTFEVYQKLTDGVPELFIKDDENVEQQLTCKGRFIGGGWKEVKSTFGTIAEITTKWPGWQLADGTNGTPDLRDKMVVGARQDDSGVAKTNVTGTLTQSGGSATKNLEHSHSPGSLTVSASGTTGASNSNGNHAGPDAFALSLPGHGHPVTVTGTVNGGVTASGLSSTQDVMNPYYALAFIARPTS